MKVFVDFELTMPTGEAYGRVSGPLDLHCIPQVGDVLSFGISPNSVAIPSGVIKGGHLAVQSRVFGVASNNLQLVLESMTARDMDAAEAVARYMSNDFSLIVEPYD